MAVATVLALNLQVTAHAACVLALHCRILLLCFLVSCVWTLVDRLAVVMTDSFSASTAVAKQWWD
jgi:hypothetical protein